MHPKAPPRVLVVDDELEMAKVIAEELGDRGYRAIAVGSGREAVERIRSEAFDVLVTDLRMPGVDGLEVLRESRELDPSRPVIVMTGHGATDAAIAAASLGAFHQLTKPFHLALLADLIEAALAAREGQTIR